MFYCEDCRVNKGWPESFSKSLGRCEYCGNIATCNDVKSSLLPKPKYTLTVRNYINKKEIKKEFDSYGEAYKEAVVVTEVIGVFLDLTRPLNIDGVMSHCDNYADIYNEARITIGKS